jgi:hypothetical protein
MNDWEMHPSIAICETSSGGVEELAITVAPHVTIIFSQWFSGSSLAPPSTSSGIN